MLDFFDFYLIGFVLAFIVGGWHLTYGQSGAILLSSGIGAPLGSLFWGWMADRIGRRTVMILTVLNFSLATGAMAFTPEYGWLFLSICRFFVGMGVTGLYTVDIAIVQEFVPAYKRGWVTGLTTSLLPAGTLLGALAGAFLEPSVGWRGLFVVGLIPALLTLLIRAWVPESPHWLIGKGRVDEARKSLAWALQVDPASIQLPTFGCAGPKDRVARGVQIPSQPGGGLPDRHQPDRHRRTEPVDDDAVRAGAEDQPESGIVSDRLGRRRSSIFGPLVLLLDVRRAGAPPRGGDKLRDRRGDDVGRRISQQRLYRRRVDLLRDDPGAELLRQRQLCDRRSVYGEVWPSKLRASGMGIGYGFGNLGKFIGPAGLAVIAGSGQLRLAEGDAGRAGPGDELLRLLVPGRRRCNLVHRHRDAGGAPSGRSTAR